MNRSIWFKGQIVDSENAKVNVLSPTAQFGLNVFEGLRGYWNDNSNQLYIFRYKEHIHRLFQSCKLIGIQSPYSEDEIFEAINQVITENEYYCDVAVRTTLFVDEEGSWSSSKPVEMFVAPIAKSRTKLSSLKGIKACVSSWERIDDRALPPRVKAGANYINGRYAFLETKSAGYDLPILLDRNGKVSESAGACIMMIRDGILITPKCTSSILESITRDTILTLAEEIGLKTEERHIDRTELYLAEELFFCGSAVELTPITQVDQHSIGLGEIGNLTCTLLNNYHSVASGESDSHQDWLTPISEKL